MKILLVLPAADHLRVDRDETNVPKRKMLRFSVLPLLTVASLTPEPHEVEICDENVTPLDFEADVDVVALSFMTAYAPRAYEIAQEFRKRGRLVVAGGYHPTFMTDEVARHVDIVVVGDAEDLWDKVINDIENGVHKSVYHHENGLPDLMGRPYARRDLMEKTKKYYVTPNAVQTGRGCVHGCRYCSITAFHKRTFRSRSIREVYDELSQLDRDMIFVDDNIIADPDYAKKLFKAIIPLKKRWVSQCSIKIADDPELLKLAYKAGCRGLFIGVETINDDNLTDVGKAFNDSTSYPQRIKRIRRAGIGVIAGVIVGLDHDTIDVFENTLKFLQKTGIDAIQINILTPLPGTELHKEFVKTGRVIDRDWSKYDFRHVVIKPAKMSAAELQNGADWLYHEFYRLDRIIVRTLRTAFTAGLVPAYLSLKLNLTYRYDNIRERITGVAPSIFRFQSKASSRYTCLKTLNSYNAQSGFKS